VLGIVALLVAGGAIPASVVAAPDSRPTAIPGAATEVADPSGAYDGPDVDDVTSAVVGRPASDARILAAYPNPAVYGDRGESVTVTLPTADNWSLSDGEATVRLNATGRVVVGTELDTLQDRTADGTVLVPAPPGFGLSNGGERLTLRRNGSRVDVLVYEDAPEGERLVRSATPRWRPVGLSPREPVDLGRPNATAFVLPDSPAVPLATLRSAERRLLVGGYTLTSERVGDALFAAAERGVRVRVLVEAEPVGGLPRREARLLDRLADAGVEVCVLGGSPERFAFHHPKYAVADGRALVLTENWKPAGTGGHDSRGWGVRLDGDRAADALAALFRRDANGTGVVAWERYRTGRAFGPADAGPANGSFRERTRPRSVAVREARLLTAPGNAESAVVDALDDADERVAVIQPTVGGPDQRMLRACLRAARRGVDVRVLLSGAWYTAEENRRLADRLNGRAGEADLPLKVRVAGPTDRFGKIHAKGVVADDTVVVGSLNWNDNSADENREVAVALRSEAAAAYYAGVFAGDWRAAGSGSGASGAHGGDEGSNGGRLPLGTLAVVLLAAVVAMGVAGRRVTFVGRDGGAAVADGEDRGERLWPVADDGDGPEARSRD
jgi:phosphatidylserine/phosphatidylglycerophosphate/cardiolipin synthase-like enzyme